jgi:hypothetical protein
MGELGLRCLAYFARAYPARARRIIRDGVPRYIYSI